MEDRELFSKLEKLGGELTPPERLRPNAVEQALRGVRRKRPTARAAAVCALVLTLTLTASVITSDMSPGSLPTAGQPPVIEAKNQQNDYTTIYKTLFAAYRESEAKKQGGADNETALAPESGAAGDSAFSKEGQPYSSTNMQAEGVQEGDISKTDGRFIYTIVQNHLTIAKAENGKLTPIYTKVIGSAPDKNNEIESTQAVQMYLQGDILTIICSGMYGAGIYAETAVCGDTARSGDTQIFIYDISDRSDPKLSGDLEISGNYLASRVVDGSLYVLTDYFFHFGDAQEQFPTSFVPSLTAGGKRRAVDSADVCISMAKPQAQYTAIASVKLDSPSDFTDAKAVMGGGNAVYCSTQSLYLPIYRYNEETQTSGLQLLKYGLSGGKITLSAEAQLKGGLLNQYSMDEYGGYFRLVTAYTNMKVSREGGSVSAEMLGETQTLYILDENLRTVGTYSNDSKDERLQSVRFVENTAYFVTFLQTDPLFAVDLSDPARPKLKSELKLPGFSRYLHPYGENLLLGFGIDADETGVQTGLKLSMFDTTDSGNVKEKHSITFSGRNGGSAALDEFKAILIAPEKGLIGLPAWELNETSYERTLCYYVFSYSGKKGFTLETRLTLDSPDDESLYLDRARGMYIGGYLYITNAPYISSYSLTDFSLTDKIKCW